MRPLWRRVIAYSLVLFLALPLAFSQVLIGAIRQPAGSPPRGVEEVHLVSSGLRLRAWLMRGGAERAAVVVVHGLGDSLESFTETGWNLNRRGHTVLLLDLRGHGGSEGRHTTMGGLEREDVRAAMQWLRDQGLAARGLILMGHSMGSVAVLRAAADTADVRGVIVEAPYDNYNATVRHHAWIYYHIPSWLPLVPVTIALSEWRAGFKAKDVDAVAAAARVHAPLLAIVDGADNRMPEPIVRRVWDAHPGPKQFWVAPGAEHVGAILNRDYWKHVIGFLDENGL